MTIYFKLKRFKIIIKANIQSANYSDSDLV